MSRARPPEGIEIASLKKKQQTVINYMATGTGTPWEDRGSSNPVSAFFATCFAGMFSPGKLVGQIRRPETTSDARALVIGSSVMWGLSAAIHTAIVLWKEAHNPTAIEVNTNTCMILIVIALLAGGGGCYLLFRVYNAIYGKLVTQEKGAGLIPDTLIYNVNAYAMGPSLLAIIPFAGPIIALLWMLMSAVAVGQARLKLKPAAAIIDAVIIYLPMLALTAGLWWAGNFILSFPLGDAVTFPDKPKTVDGTSSNSTPGSTPPGATPSGANP